MYGQTEATARISYLPAKDCLRKIGSVGIAVPDSKIVLVDEENNFINKAGEQGDIVCVGPQVSMGYAETEEDLTRKDDNGKILFAFRVNIFVICSRDQIPRKGNGKIDYGCSDFCTE